MSVKADLRVILGIDKAGFDRSLSSATASVNRFSRRTEAAKKNVTLPPVQESSEYKALQAEFDGYKAMNNARNSADYSTVKPKFFEAVYNKIDRSENAKPVKEQLENIKQTYEEYFLPTEEPPKVPVFGAQTKGEPPKGDEGAAFGKYWNFVPRKE